MNTVASIVLITPPVAKYSQYETCIETVISLEGWHAHVHLSGNNASDTLVSVPDPDPKPTPPRIASRTLYWKRYMCRMRSGDEI